MLPVLDRHLRVLTEAVHRGGTTLRRLPEAVLRRLHCGGTTSRRLPEHGIVPAKALTCSTVVVHMVSEVGCTTAEQDAGERLRVSTSFLRFFQAAREPGAVRH
jgi:hypothetical protein